MTVTDRENALLPEPTARIEPPQGTMAKRRFFVPVGLVVAGAATLMLLLGPEARLDVVKFAVVYILPGGIDLAVPIAVGVLDLDPVYVVLLVMYFDGSISLFWIWNLDHLTRFDRIDRWVTKSRARAERLWERRPWLRFASLWGLAAFIFLPLFGTGSFTGIVGGKLIELPDWQIWIASVLGTSVRVALLALGTEALFG